MAKRRKEETRKRQGATAKETGPGSESGGGDCQRREGEEMRIETLEHDLSCTKSLITNILTLEIIT